MIIVERKPTAKDYCNLRISSGMGLKEEENAKIALDNSLYVISLYDEEKLIGLGRIIGDGAISFTVTDIMVDRAYQGKGYGSIIMEHINEYFEKSTDDDAYIMLIANKPANKLYEKFHFVQTEPNACGMLRIKK